MPTEQAEQREQNARTAVKEITQQYGWSEEQQEMLVQVLLAEIPIELPIEGYRESAHARIVKENADVFPMVEKISKDANAAMFLISKASADKDLVREFSKDVEKFIAGLKQALSVNDIVVVVDLLKKLSETLYLPTRQYITSHLDEQLRDGLFDRVDACVADIQKVIDSLGKSKTLAALSK